MTKRNKIFDIMVILLVFIFGGSSARADETFGKQMTTFSESQRILQHLVSGKKMININATSVFWVADVKKLYDSARNNPINQPRTTALAEMLETLEHQRYDEYRHLDSFIEDILNAAFSDELDLLCSIAICAQMETFLNKHRFVDDAKDKIRKSKEKLRNFTKETLLPKVQERFEDKDLKALVEDFEKLFPDAKAKLKFNSGSGCVNNFDESCQLFDNSMNAYWSLNKCSALANFREWGTHMLNYLLLDHNQIMIDEFKKQLSNYRRTFKVQ